MKVHVSSINFAPDHAGIAVYATDFPVYLAEQGDEVSMITGFPYYPRWAKRLGDGGRLFARESYRGVNVRRGYLYVPRRVTSLKRLWHELSFCLFAAINMLCSGRPDVIVVFTPPFLLGSISVLMKVLWRCPLVINVQDLPIDAALALDMVKTGSLMRLTQALELWTYRRADLVVTISPAMLGKLTEKGIPSGRLMLCPNWIDIDTASRATMRGNFLAKQPHAREKFTIAYAGNLGVKQGVDVLLRVAEALKSSPAFHFFVIGDGADEARLSSLADEMNLRNLTFLPFMDPAEYREVLADMDVMFVAQRAGSGSNFFPSKLLGLLAQSKPLLAAADSDSELARVISDVGCGLVSAYGDIGRLVESVRSLAATPEITAEMGRRGRKYVAAYDRSSVLGAWRRRVSGLLPAAVGRGTSTAPYDTART